MTDDKRTTREYVAKARAIAEEDARDFGETTSEEFLRECRRAFIERRRMRMAKRLSKGANKET